MRKLIVLCAMCATILTAFAQNAQEKTFCGYLYNDDYKVYLKIDFYDNNITVPGQEIFGTMPGYLGALRDSRKWLITSADIIDAKTANISITNDYGSEDLEATLECAEDGSYLLRQNSGSRIKIVVDRKWVKLPTELTFVRSEPKKDLW